MTNGIVAPRLEHVGRRGSRWTGIVAFVVVLLLSQAGSSMAAGRGCPPAPSAPRLEHLASLPPLHEVSPSGRLPFGPGQLRLATYDPLLNPGAEVLFSLGASDARLNFDLGWTGSISARRTTHDGVPQGRTISRQFSIPPGRLGLYSATFSLSLHAIGVYRVSLGFFAADGSKLGRFERYVQVAPRIERARIALFPSRAGNGSVLHFRIENRGTTSVGFGVDYGLLSRTPAGWRDISPGGGFPPVGEGLLPEHSGPCASLSFHPNLPPGEYRFRKRVEFGSSPAR